MRLQPGTVLGRYVVVDRIGSGGMGEVYRARDTRLEKIVAIKTISIAYAEDPTSQARFDRERRVAAGLDHPHICRVLDAGHQEGIEYLVMECLEGESLAARLKRGALSVPDALQVGIEIADALAHAHKHGVIHRDLKPANVYLTLGGAKVLDFGLAKWWQVNRPGSLHDDAITKPVDQSHGGDLLGTRLYMAPERLLGHEADHRTDVFGFGLLLYEMLTARHPFEAPTATALVAAIAGVDPPPMQLAGPRGAELEWAVRKCLAKDPAERWQAMSDVRSVLAQIADNSGRRVPVSRARRLAFAAAGAAAVILLFSAAALWSRRAAPDSGAAAPRMTIFTVPPPGGGLFTPTEGSVQTPQLALSPDGRALAFVAAGEDRVSQIWIRSMDSPAPRAVAGTVDATYPFWSFDNRALGFFARGQLRRVDLAGGPPRTIADARDGRGGTWSRNGVILFAPDTSGTLFSVPAEGGVPVQRTHLESARAETSHRWPQFLSDATSFIYFARSTQPAHEGIYAGSLEGAGVSFILNSGFGAAYAPPSQLLYIADNTLMMRTLDVARRHASGEPRAIAEHVGGSSNFYGPFSASQTGVLAYANTGFSSQLVWFDRHGERRMAARDGGGYVDFDLSASDTVAAVAEIDPASDRSDIYLLDLSRGTRERMTAARETDASPVWSPDGSRLIFRSNREQVHDLYQRIVHGSGPEQVFVKSPLHKYPTSWSPDGRSVLFHAKEGTQWDVWLAPVLAPESARRFMETPFNEMQAQISPDGRSVAYTSNESGALEVYIEPLDRKGRRWLTSAGGGSDPKWNPGGSELFYLAPDGSLMAVTVPAGSPEAAGAPRRLFQAVAPTVAEPFTSVYDVTHDGSRFLFRVPLQDVRSEPLRVQLGSATTTQP